MEKIFSVMFRLTHIPRWGDYSTKYKDNAASHTYRMSCLSLIISKLENKNGFKNDEESVLLKSLFHDFNEVKTGPIKHETKKDENLRLQIKKLEKKKSEEILKLFPELLQEEFRSYVVDAEDNSVEGRIVDAADSLDALIFCNREIESENSQYFNKVHDRIEKKLINSEFKSVRKIVKEISKKNSDTEKLVSTILNMDRIERWSGKFNNIPDDDATHSFRVAAMLAVMCKYEEKKTGKKTDIAEVIGKALFHDLPESISGDINGPIKHSTEELKVAFEDFERGVAKKIFNWIPGDIKDEFVSILINSKDKSKEGIYVDIGDKVDALLKSLLEMYHSSAEYKEIYKRQLINLRNNYREKSIVNYFLSETLHDANLNY